MTPRRLDEMADVVNLDAMIPREDFNSEEGVAAGQKGKTEASKTDLTKGENFYLTLRKPDFQRETAAWSPEAICSFLESFVNGDLIPAVICWQSASRLTFVIDGAHRLSAVMAWLQDDYGAGDESVRFYNNNIPLDQRKIHEKTRAMVNSRVGSYKDIKAEAEHPGSNPGLTERARALGNTSAIPLLWVMGNDSKKAERAFLTINQSAVAIDPTEFMILNSRNRANAISSRAIVRNGTGHRYWKDFSVEAQEQVVKHGKYIYKALYDPPLDPPIKTWELPIAGHGYGTQTLPLIFDFVNIANGIEVVDSSKKVKVVQIKQEEPEEEATTQCLKNTLSLADIFTGTTPTSLGLHPAVYFYSASGRHQPTSVLALAALFIDLKKENKFIDFCRVRESFENFLLDHKMYINQLTSKQGSMAKGFRHMRDYYRYVLDMLWGGKTHDEIEVSLPKTENFRRLVKEVPILSTTPKKFSRGVKQYIVIKEALANASICELCRARIDLKAMNVDHIKDRSKGGVGSGENARPLHPYCNSTYKRWLEEHSG